MGLLGDGMPVSLGLLNYSGMLTPVRGFESRLLHVTKILPETVIRLRGPMDTTRRYGRWDGGSIPSEGTLDGVTKMRLWDTEIVLPFEPFAEHTAES